MPKSKGLFKRAILQSGGGHLSLSVTEAQKVTKTFEQLSGQSATRESLENIPRSKLTEYQIQLSTHITTSLDNTEWQDIRKKVMSLQPIVDGDTLPDFPSKVFASDRGLDADLLLGSTAEEWRLFLVLFQIYGKINDQIFNSVAMFGDPSELKTIYQKQDPSADINDLFSAVWSDIAFRLPTLRVAESNVRKKNKTFVYNFGWKSPPFGAGHSCEIPFVFHNLASAVEFTGPNPPVELADRIHKAWIDFIRDGDPGWSEYDLTNRPVMNFDIVSSIVKDPFSISRTYWEEKGY